MQRIVINRTTAEHLLTRLGFVQSGSVWCKGHQTATIKPVMFPIYGRIPHKPWQGFVVEWPVG